MNGHDFVKPGMEIVAQHGRARMFEIKIRMVGDVGSGGDVEFFARGDVLNDAGHARDAEFTKHVGAVTAVVEDQAVFNIDGVHEIGAKTHGNADYADEIAGRRVAGDVGRL